MYGAIPAETSYETNPRKLTSPSKLNTLKQFMHAMKNFM